MLWAVPPALERLGMLPSLAIALSCTALLALGAPPGGITSLIWLAYIPLALVARLPQFSPRQSFFIAWFGGLGAGLFGFPWIAELLVRFAGFPWWLAIISLLAFSAWTAVQFGLWGLGLKVGPRGGLKGVVWSVALWVALANLWPALFPYTAVLGLAQTPIWIQAAELGGTALVEAQIVGFGVIVADAIGAEDHRRRGILLGVAAAWFASFTALGAVRMEMMDAEAAEARSVTFGVVQPNTPLRWSDRADKMHRLRTSSRKAEDRGAQVILWPEAGVYPYGVLRPFVHDFVDHRRKVLAEHDLPTIFGAPSREPGARYGYNTVYNMDAEGNVLGFFDKVHLMPFGEYVPIVDPVWAKSKIPALNHNLRGAGPVRFTVTPDATAQNPTPEPFHVGPLICYEDIFPDFARRTAALDGGLETFVNLTIDTWFGDTAEPWEHLALAQFRSVEHRIPMVRSVSTGPSTVIDHNGRVVAELPVHSPEPDVPVPPQILVEDVPLPRNTAEDPTVYALGGFLLIPLSQLVTAVWLVVWIVRWRRAGQGVGPGRDAPAPSP